jgi:hypothetical protein
MTAQLFRQSIAKSLKPLTQGSEAKITSLLGAPKSTLQHQFTIPVPKLLLPNKNANQTSQDLASKVWLLIQVQK